MARKVKEAEFVPSMDELKMLADEVNAVLNPTTPVKYSKKTTVEELLESIKAEATGNIYEIDFQPDPDDDAVIVFSEEAEELIKKLGIEIKEGAPEVADANEEPADEDAPEEVEEVEEVKETRKEKAARKKAEKEEATKTDAKKKDKPAPAKEEKVKKSNFTRNNALVAALLKTVKKPMTKQEICELSDTIYIENGGESGAFVAEVMFRYSVPAFVELGHIIKKDGTFQYVK